jgi:metal-sulfur cluster biosynthetic enzyme
LQFVASVPQPAQNMQTVRYNYNSKIGSNAILNKTTRKKLLLSSEQKSEYTDSIVLFALVPEIDQKNNTFQIESDFGSIKCPFTESIKDNVFTAFKEYKNKTYISLKGTALFNWNDKIQEVCEVESIDVLDSLDVSLRIYNLLKLENNWFEGQGKALNKECLTKFGNLFNSYFDSKLPLPAIFPKIRV